MSVSPGNQGSFKKLQEEQKKLKEERKKTEGKNSKSAPLEQNSNQATPTSTIFRPSPVKKATPSEDDNLGDTDEDIEISEELERRYGHLIRPKSPKE